MTKVKVGPNICLLILIAIVLQSTVYFWNNAIKLKQLYDYTSINIILIVYLIFLYLITDISTLILACKFLDVDISKRTFDISKNKVF